MDLKQLEYFVRIAETGSFTRAALLLDVSQPSLSRQVRQLETELRQHLLYRTGRGVELTEAGRSLLAHGNAVLRLVAQMRDELNNLRGRPTGRVTVGLPPRVAHVLSPPLVESFRREFPDASISVAEALSAHLREWLALGRIELALLYDPQPDHQIVCETLFRENLVLAGWDSPRARLPTKVPVADLGTYPLILPSMPNAIRSLIESACRRKGVALRIVAEVDAVHTILELAARGQGYAVLPRSAIFLHSRERGVRLAVATIRAPEVRNNLVLAMSRHRPLTLLARETMRLIRQANVPALFADPRSAAGDAKRSVASPTK